MVLLRWSKQDLQGDVKLDSWTENIITDNLSPTRTNARPPVKAVREKPDAPGKTTTQFFLRAFARRPIIAADVNVRAF
jgi:hypothetical protein